MNKIAFLFTLLVILSYLGCQNAPISQFNSDNAPGISTTVPKPLIILQDIPCPRGFERRGEDDYGNWMRKLKLSKDNTVYYYNGDKKPNQSIHVAVLNFDIGTRDLQQCADACMRIRAEYLFEQKRIDELKFLLASGKWKSFSDYTAKRDYTSFRKYMNYIFAFANTTSLKQQLKPVSNFDEMKIGDVFVQSGNPYGHAVTVMDMCENKEGKKLFMLSQSYMPAQSIEILINPKSTNKSSWYPVDFEGDLETPEWVFHQEDLRRF